MSKVIVELPVQETGAIVALILHKAYTITTEPISGLRWGAEHFFSKEIEKLSKYFRNPEVAKTEIEERECTGISPNTGKPVRTLEFRICIEITEKENTR
jgi:hypothetical protein